MTETAIYIHGLDELIKRMGEAKVQRAAARRMKEAVQIVEREAKHRAPVDTGRLRASITNDVREMGSEIQGVVGSNVLYAPYQEFGTRYMEGRFYITHSIEAKESEIADRLLMALDDVAAQIAGD